MSKYRKTVAAAGTWLATLGAFLSDGTIDATEGSALLIGAAGVIAVFFFPNAQQDA